MFGKFDRDRFDIGLGWSLAFSPQIYVRLEKSFTSLFKMQPDWGGPHLCHLALDRLAGYVNDGVLQTVVDQVRSKSLTRLSSETHAMTHLPTGLHSRRCWEGDITHLQSKGHRRHNHNISLVVQRISSNILAEFHLFIRTHISCSESISHRTGTIARRVAFSFWFNFLFFSCFSLFERQNRIFVECASRDRRA